MKKQVLIAANISDAFKELLENKDYSLVPLGHLKDKNNIEGIITSTKLRLDATTLSSYPALNWIGRLGSGLEIIDQGYCGKHNIKVASSPAGISNAVAEHCISSIIALQKNIASSTQEIQNKQWIREANRGWELENKTIGLIGYGHTGMAFAKKLSVFNVCVIAYDKYKKDFEDAYAKEVSLTELQKSADIISFHIPLNNETTHYYNEAFIASCKQHIVMNTSRGAVVSTKDLLKALKNKKTKGAVLDVLENEHTLITESSEEWKWVKQLQGFNTLITPHIAGYSHNAIEKMSAELMEKLESAF